MNLALSRISSTPSSWMVRLQKASAFLKLVALVAGCSPFHIHHHCAQPALQGAILFTCKYVLQHFLATLIYHPCSLAEIPGLIYDYQSVTKHFLPVICFDLAPGRSHSIRPFRADQNLDRIVLYTATLRDLVHLFHSAHVFIFSLFMKGFPMTWKLCFRTRPTKPFSQGILSS